MNSRIENIIISFFGIAEVIHIKMWTASIIKEIKRIEFYMKLSFAEKKLMVVQQKFCLRMRVAYSNSGVFQV